jgi:hypothetical protein
VVEPIPDSAGDSPLPQSHGLADVPPAQGVPAGAIRPPLVNGLKVHRHGTTILSRVIGACGSATGAQTLSARAAKPGVREIGNSNPYLLARPQPARPDADSYPERFRIWPKHTEPR